MALLAGETDFERTVTMTTKPLTNRQIELLESYGFRRWTKYGKDRLYAKPTCGAFDVVFTYTRRGYVSCAYYDGESTSGCEGKRIRDATMFVDVKTGKFFNDCSSTDFSRFARKRVEELLASVAQDGSGAKEAMIDD